MIHLFFPASYWGQEGQINKRVASLKTVLPQLDYQPPKLDSAWPFYSGSTESRSKQLNANLLDSKATVLWAARGGYGTSDLLRQIPWSILKQQPPKLIVGFSDISALQAALFSQINWPGLHAPMPMTELWSQENNAAQRTCELIASFHDQRFKDFHNTIAVKPISGSTHRLTGRIFGGCFSVLTQLIGTPFLPKSLDDYILFFEDTHEHPARLLRYLNQWIDSGLMGQAKAIVWGDFRHLAPNEEQTKTWRALFLEEVCQRLSCPMYETSYIGHVEHNEPVCMGAFGTLDGTTLNWSWTHEQSTA